MQVSRLEAFGFKSFMERLVLPLGSGVTGVVGPNGCGKSNIVDALRWVMGETRASQLRGDLLEDVIFNGTEKHRPLGLAEVSIVIRATGASLLDDVIASMETSEFRGVNQSPLPSGPIDPIVTTGDAVAESEESVQADSGVREEAENLDAIAAFEGSPGIANSNDPVAEAAVETDVAENTDALPVGVEEQQDSGQVVASSEVTSAALRAEPVAAGENSAVLTRFGWLKGVSEVQVTRRLYRSGESEYFINKVQCRLKDVKEFFRAVGLGARGYTIIAQGEIGRIVSAKPEDRRLLIEEAAQVAGFREQITTVRRRLEESRTSIARLDDILKEVTRQVGSLKRQAARAIARVELKSELRDGECKLFRHTVRSLSEKFEAVAVARAQLQKEEEHLVSELTEISTQESELNTCRDVLERQVAELRAHADNLRAEVNRHLRERASREMKVREIQSALSARTNDLERSDERANVLVQRKDESKLEVTRLEAEETKLAQELAEIDTSGEKRLREVSEQLQKLREEVRQKDRTVRELRDRMVSAQSRFDALQNQLVAASPTAQLQKTLNSSELPADIRKGAKLVIDGLQVPPRYAKAVQAVLAERAGFLVSEDPFAVGRIFSGSVLNRDPRNKRQAAIGIIRTAEKVADESCTADAVQGEVHPLAAQIDIKPWCRGAADFLFKDIFVAESIDSACAYLESLPEDQHERREQLQIVTFDGDIVSWRMVYSLRHEGGLVQLKVQLDETQTLVASSSAAYEEIAATRDGLQKQVSELEQTYAELLRYTQQCQARIREISTSVGSVRGKLQAERRLSSQVEGDLERLLKQKGELEKQLSVLNGYLTEAQAVLAELPATVDAEVENEINHLNAQVEARQNELRQARIKVDEARGRVDGLRKQLDRARISGNDRLMENQRLTFELQRHQGEIEKEYGAEVLAALTQEAPNSELLPNEERIALADRMTAVRNRIHREGEVDPASVEQYEVEQTRLDDLTTQRMDLESAATTLHHTLHELTEACRTRFLTTFEAIRSKFSEFAPQLYGGGSADIILVDPSNPLESGVEVAARPPGKKLKSIDLLSGGEKALCATALVFAMFMSRPSPLCVLDEVDAPLDEANVMRFLQFIKGLSTSTQFLMITHNKQSMAAADALVGVTMQEPGVTKTLSVSFQEAVRNAA